MIHPDFLIIGAQKCGTSSLHDLLSQHPDIAPPIHKEVHYFDLNYHRGRSWYEGHFKSAMADRDAGKRRRMTFETTPYYVFHPRVPALLARDLPGVRLILLLRDPVERAFSHYRMEVRYGIEKLSFEEALDAEEERLRGAEDMLVADVDSHCFNHQQFSYVARGRYVEQVRRFYRYFPADRMLVIRTEDLAARPLQTLRQVHDFLGIREVDPTDLQPRAVFNPDIPMRTETRLRLRSYFHPFNRDLADLLDWTDNWPLADTLHANAAIRS